MAVKSRIVNKGDVFEFPALMKHTTSDCIVLFVDNNTGTMLSGTETDFRKLYVTRTDWFISNFEKFDGEIVIKND